MKTKIFRALYWSFIVVSIVVTFIPDNVINSISSIHIYNNDFDIMIDKIIIYLVALFISLTIAFFRYHFAQKVTIKGKDFTIKIVYKDLFEIKDAVKVINFDECFSTNVGSDTGDIKPSSVCGQYLTRYKLTEANIDQFVQKTNIKPLRNKSKYQNKKCYLPGTIISNGDYLLMAFAKLDSDGRGVMTRDEYIQCLFHLWDEIDKYHGEKDVAIPILGSNITRFKNDSLSQQELLDIMIGTYKMTTNKPRKPYKLIICCKVADDFSLNKIGSFF